MRSICFRTDFFFKCGPGSSVGIATDYGLDGPGSNPGGDEIFRPSRPALGPTQPPVQWVPVLSGGKERPRRDADPSPLLVPWLRKSRATPLSLYGSYGLYRDSVPVQGCTLPLPNSRAIPLLSLWAVRSVQSLSACTMVHFTFT